jgi:hypothetical protein
MIAVKAKPGLTAGFHFFEHTLTQIKPSHVAASQMSALGQKRTRTLITMSALTLKADMRAP